MDTHIAEEIWRNPQSLLHEATRLLATDTPHTTEQPDAAAQAIQRAHALISPDLYVIERLKTAGVDPDYQGLLARAFDEKIAALIYLARHKLLDIEQSTLQSRDLDDARRDLSTYVEVLYAVEAIDGLGLLYDFAAIQRDSRVPQLWRNVCARCLHLLALLEGQRAAAIRFLNQRPAARQLLQTLSTATRADIAHALRALHEDYGQLVEHLDETPPTPAASYTQRYQQLYGDVQMDEAGSGVSSFLSAKDRIEQAAVAGDLPALLNWVGDGSPAAMRTALSTALRVMTNDQYLLLMERLLDAGTLDPVRMTAIVLALGDANRAAGHYAGVPHINRLLSNVAGTAQDEYIGVAQVAVRELGRVVAHAELRGVLEHAPLTPVAEAALGALAELRRLPAPGLIREHRPDLLPLYQRCRAYLLEVQNLMDTIWACRTMEMSLIYLQQLKDLRAIPELQQLIMGEPAISEWAKAALHDLGVEVAENYR